MNIVRSVTASLLLIPVLAVSYPNGVPGSTAKTSTQGCFCHGNANPTSGVSVLIAGLSTLKIGATGTYTVTVTDAAGSGTKSGVDIAASGGTLAPVTSTLKLSSGELVTSQATNVPATYTFTFTAPATAGTATLYATGLGKSKTAWNNAPNFSIIVTPATSVTQESSTPASFRVEQNYPNPFNPSTRIRFSLPAASSTSVKIYDMEGREVATLGEGMMAAGVHTAEWNASGFPSGVYLCRVRSGSYTVTKKLLLQK